MIDNIFGLRVRESHTRNSSQTSGCSAHVMYRTRENREIRRWILENDWLEAIVALPEQLFYNTGISTYIWALTNRKSLGDKRREISKEHIARISDIFLSFTDGEYSKIFDTTDFGYRKITVERPLRLNFQANAECIALLKQQKAFQDLATSKKKNLQEKTAEEAEGRTLQEAMLAMLSRSPLRKRRNSRDLPRQRRQSRAWINTAMRDHKDGEIGKVGYEINFNRYFYRYQPSRPLAEIESEIKLLERDILEMLREVAG